MKHLSEITPDVVLKVAHNVPLGQAVREALVENDRKRNHRNIALLTERTRESIEQDDALVEYYKEREEREARHLGYLRGDHLLEDA